MWQRWRLSWKRTRARDQQWRRVLGVKVARSLSSLVPVRRLDDGQTIWVTRTTFALAWLVRTLPLWGAVSVELLLITVASITARDVQQASVLCQALASVWVVVWTMGIERSERIARLTGEAGQVGMFHLGAPKTLPPRFGEDA